MCLGLEEHDKFIRLQILEIVVAFSSIINSIIANNYSIDIICVMGMCRDWTVTIYYIRSLGVYAYRSMKSNIEDALVVQVGLAGFLGFLVYMLSSYIGNLYKIPMVQYEELVQCLKIIGIVSPILALGDMMYSWANRNGYLQKISIANGIKIVTSIVVSLAVVLCRLDIEIIFIGEAITYVVMIIYLFISTKFYRIFKFRNISFKGILSIIKSGSNIALMKQLCYGGQVISNIFVSSLGTTSLSIYSVCRTFIAFGSGVANSIITGVLWDMDIGKTIKDKFRIVRTKSKKYVVPVSIVTLVVGLIVLVLIKGKLSYLECLPFILLQSLFIFPKCVSNLFEALLTGTNNNKFIKYSGFITAIVYIGLNALYSAVDIGLIAYCLLETVNCLAVVIYYGITVRNLSKNLV